MSPRSGSLIGQKYLESLRGQAVPPSTRKHTKWAILHQRDWAGDRNKLLPEKNAPEDLENLKEKRLTLIGWNIALNLFRMVPFKCVVVYVYSSALAT